MPPPPALLRKNRSKKSSSESTLKKRLQKDPERLYMAPPMEPTLIQLQLIANIGDLRFHYYLPWPSMVQGPRPPQETRIAWRSGPTADRPGRLRLQQEMVQLLLDSGALIDAADTHVAAEIVSRWPAAQRPAALCLEVWEKLIRGSGGWAAAGLPLHGGHAAHRPFI